MEIIEKEVKRIVSKRLTNSHFQRESDSMCFEINVNSVSETNPKTNRQKNRQPFITKLKGKWQQKDMSKTYD